MQKGKDLLNDDDARTYADSSVGKLTESINSISGALYNGGSLGPTGIVFISKIESAIKSLREAEDLLLRSLISSQNSLETFKEDSRKKELNEGEL